MSFISDKQTLEDLNLLGRYKSNSIYRLFDHTITGGGRQLLEEMFRQPLTDASQINDRVRCFRYFGNHRPELPFSAADFEIMESYLSSVTGNLVETGWNTILKKVRSQLTGGQEYAQLEAGCRQTIITLQSIRKMVMPLTASDDHPVADPLSILQQFFQRKEMQWLNEADTGTAIPLAKLIRYNHCLREKMKQEIKELLPIIYWLDVNIAVSGVAATRGFCYPAARPAAEQVIDIEGLYHPGLSKAVSNQTEFSAAHNLIFLTGANMAGKSTFMKSFGVAIYLAHMGFPVAASQMRFSVKDGIYSSINVPDDLEHGYSHFYAEVLRVKTVATAVDSGKNLVIIFDELFKGTNVKDAYEATLSITAAFSRHRNCCFIISTHIIEAGHALQEQTAHIRFRYMPTVMQGNIPTYTYKIQEGITSDRQGMLIIENEKILDLIQQ
ncbi:MutS-related protein [Pseudobacter ginsenosidimutans]|uniref:MutS-like protein n=1 Tax=Pseudobacter ginsenosidimutans TaxID=661488 RepID=A0A4Q7N2Y0_9BACT|nr:DNA mismatch repair protein [Pseudobacter ginsenosidimutans]QEC43224.1 DNA mismatch repair protein [Pseudobacter ginsenosidimutans]RZS74585.1 MutS-like protein [Pseudobacter ginsenosidimutans]